MKNLGWFFLVRLIVSFSRSEKIGVVYPSESHCLICPAEKNGVWFSKRVSLSYFSGQKKMEYDFTVSHFLYSTMEREKTMSSHLKKWGEVSYHVSLSHFPGLKKFGLVYPSAYHCFICQTKKWGVIFQVCLIVSFVKLKKWGRFSKCISLTHLSN